jgi:hypothetical protein
VSIGHDNEETAERGWPERPPPRDQPRPRSRSKAIPVEQHLWRHSIESGVLVMLGVIALTAAFAKVTPVWFIVVAGLSLTVVIWYTSLRTTASLVMANYLGSWGFLVTAWMAAAAHIGVWHSYMLAALCIPGGLLAVLGAPAIGHHREEVRRADEEHERKADVLPLRRWERRLARLGAGNLAILDISDDEAGNKQVTGRLGKATEHDRGYTFDQLAALADPLARDLRLPAGSIHFEQPRGQGFSAADFIIHVREQHGPRPEIYLPAENFLRSINKPFPIGQMANRRPFEMTYREVVVMVIGVRGSGKSNLENVFIAQLARCLDALIFMIDLKGGRAARPWMMPWIQGHAERPVVDWLATTREEADLMLDALLAAGDARSRSGSDGQGGFGEKITPSFDTPAIILVVDETAVMTGHNIRTKDENGNILSNTSLATKLARLAETYRSEAIDPLVAALRGNIDIMGSTAVKAMATYRIGLACADATDGGRVFPDDYRAAQALARLGEPGLGLVKDGPDISPPIRFFRITEQLITDIALWAADAGALPEPEDRIKLAMGAAYEERWDREHGQALKREWRESAGLPGAQAREGDGDYWSIVASIEDPDKPPDPRHAELRRIMIEQAKLARQQKREPGGYTVGRLVSLLALRNQVVRREVVTRWLGKDKERGMVLNTGKPLHRWVWTGPLDEIDIPGMGSAT